MLATTMNRESLKPIVLHRLADKLLQNLILYHGSIAYLIAAISKYMIWKDLSMRLKNLDLIIAMLIAVINVGWALLPNRSFVVSLILALPLVFLLPGYTL